MARVQVCLLLYTWSVSKTTKNLKNLGFELPSLILQKLDLIILPPHIQKRNSFPDFPEQTLFPPCVGGGWTRQHIRALGQRWGGEGITGAWPPIPAPPGRLSASKRLSISGSALS